MIKVITYGTYDLLHYGHIKLLERAKTLGDYLIVGVTSDAFDKARGKINVKQPLLERIAAVKETGLADEIIVEEYEGQKIDDIKRYDIDIFTVGSDWIGKFDYLNEYCKVIYLPRTVGVSSSDIRAEKRMIRLGFAGKGNMLIKYITECMFVNGIMIAGVFTQDEVTRSKVLALGCLVTSTYDDLLNDIDALYLLTYPSQHFDQIKKAFAAGKHILCESPIALTTNELDELLSCSEKQNLILMESIKTAYSMAYRRMLLLVKSGCIGQVVSIDATCTSLSSPINPYGKEQEWNSVSAWGPTAILPIFQMLGTGYQKKTIASSFVNENQNFDIFTKVDFYYPNAVASIKVGKGVKSEGELIISGTKGYIYVPAPWWKTDYFEIRYENPSENRRYFYQLEGEGIRYEFVNFVKAIETGRCDASIERRVTRGITLLFEDFLRKKDLHSFTVQ